MNILNITWVCCGSWLNIALFVWFQRTTPEQTCKSSGKIQPVKSELSRLTCPSVDLVGNQPSRYIIPVLYGPVTHPGGSWSASCMAGRATGHRLAGEARDAEKSLIHTKSSDFRVIPPFKDYKHQEMPGTKKRQFLFNERSDWLSHLVHGVLLKWWGSPDLIAWYGRRDHVSNIAGPNQNGLEIS